MNAPFIIEVLLNADVKTVWTAITDKDKMKLWYFDLPEFKLVVGSEFRFYGGPPEKQYLHICIIKEVIEFKKISYSWRYDGYEGDSLVSFELFEEGNKTRIKLTHSGLDTFPDNPDFVRENFVAGWTEIIQTSLKDFVEKK